jgi:hypothetical protein
MDEKNKHFVVATVRLFFFFLRNLQNEIFNVQESWISPLWPLVRLPWYYNLATPTLSFIWFTCEAVIWVEPCKINYIFLCERINYCFTQVWCYNALFHPYIDILLIYTQETLQFNFLLSKPWIKLFDFREINP